MANIPRFYRGTLLYKGGVPLRKKVRKMKRIIVACVFAFTLLATSAGVAGASGGPAIGNSPFGTKGEFFWEMQFPVTTHQVPVTNPCVRDLYSTLASLGSHPRRSDVDAAVTDYIDCRGGATSFGSPFQFEFPVSRPFNFGLFPGEFSDFGGGNNFFLIGERCVLNTFFNNNSESFGTWEFVNGHLECVA